MFQFNEGDAVLGQSLVLLFPFLFISSKKYLNCLLKDLEFISQIIHFCLNFTKHNNQFGTLGLDDLLQLVLWQLAQISGDMLCSFNQLLEEMHNYTIRNHPRHTPSSCLYFSSSSSSSSLETSKSSCFTVSNSSSFKIFASSCSNCSASSLYPMAILQEHIPDRRLRRNSSSCCPKQNALCQTSSPPPQSRCRSRSTSPRRSRWKYHRNPRCQNCLTQQSRNLKNFCPQSPFHLWVSTRREGSILSELAMALCLCCVWKKGTLLLLHEFWAAFYSDRLLSGLSRGSFSTSLFPSVSFLSLWIKWIESLWNGAREQAHQSMSSWG